jgi:hypothetical protein
MRGSVNVKKINQNVTLKGHILKRINKNPIIIGVSDAGWFVVCFPAVTAHCGWIFTAR